MQSTATQDTSREHGPAHPTTGLTTLSGWLATAILVLALGGIAAAIVIAPQVDSKSQERLSHGIQTAVMIAASLAALIGAWRQDRDGRIVSLVFAACGAVVASCLQRGGLERMLSGRTTLLGTACIVAMIVLIVVLTRLVSRGAPRQLLYAAWLDTSIFAFAITIVLGVAWGSFANGGVVQDPLVLVGLVAVIAWAGAALLLLLAREVRLQLGGPYAMLGGMALLASSGLITLGSIGPSGDAPTMLPVDVLYGIGIVLAARGALSWSMDGNPAMGRSFAVRRLRDMIPTMSIMASVILYVLSVDGQQKVPLGFLVAEVAVVAGVALAGLRQVPLKEYEWRARGAEAAAATELAAYVDDRRRVGKALAGLEAAGTVEETADRICRRAIELPGVGFAILVRTEGDGAFVPVAAAGLETTGELGRPLSPEHTAHLMAHLGDWTGSQATAVPARWHASRSSETAR